MKETIFLVIKGFIMGIANIIPGVSGGTLALTLGIYERFIASISHFFSKLKEKIKFLVPVFLGMGLSILTMSNLIDSSFKHFPVPTTLFFMGLVIGGIPLLKRKVMGKKETKEVSSYIIMALTFLLVIFLAIIPDLFSGFKEASFTNMSVSSYIILLLVGVVAAATMVIPGVSGSLVLMLLGYYFPVVKAIKDLAHLKNIPANILVLGIFGIGIVIGIVGVAKIIEFLLKKFEVKTYFGVLGFIVASIIAIPISVYHEVAVLSFTISQIIIGLILLVLGSIVGYKLGGIK